MQQTFSTMYTSNGFYKTAHQFKVSTSALNLEVQKKCLEQFVDQFFLIGDIELTVKTYEKYSSKQLEQFENQFKSINIEIGQYQLTEEVRDFINKQYSFRGSENNVTPEIQLKIYTENILPQFFTEAQEIGITFDINSLSNKIKLDSNSKVNESDKVLFFNKISKHFDQCCILNYTSSSEKERDLKQIKFASSKFLTEFSKECISYNSSSNFSYSFFVLLQNTQQNMVNLYQSQLNDILKKMNKWEAEKLAQCSHIINDEYLENTIQTYEKQMKNLVVEIQFLDETRMNIKIICKLLGDSDVSQQDILQGVNVLQQITKQIQKNEPYVEIKSPNVSQSNFKIKRGNSNSKRSILTTSNLPYEFNNKTKASKQVRKCVISYAITNPLKLQALKHSHILLGILNSYKNEYQISFEGKISLISPQNHLIINIESKDQELNQENLDNYVKNRLEQVTQINMTLNVDEILKVTQSFLFKEKLIYQISLKNNEYIYFGLEQDLEQLQEDLGRKNN